ncbi:MAG: outer membrane beta-barrel protein [Candidatus Polarisedimenticolia bacterium]
MDVRSKLRWPVLVSSAVAALVLSGTASRSEQTPSEFARYRYDAVIGIGPSYPEEDIGLLGNASGGTAFMVGFGHRIVGVLMGEIEFGVTGREHDVSSIFLKDDPTLGLTWLSYSLLARFNVGRFEPFIGIGAGQGQADLEVVTEPFAPPELEIAEDRGLLLNYRAGFDVALGPKHRLGLEVRRTDCEVDLGGFTDGEAQAGGVSALLSYRYTFGKRKLSTAGTP